MTQLKAVKADITTLAVDAIVNAANSSLMGGGGVDGAIHRAAGPELVDECLKLGGCQTGEAKITQGFRLPAKYVIHAVGPVWNGGIQGEEKLLAACYRRALEIAVDLKLETVAFPAISTGIYGFPMEKAANIAVKTVKQLIDQPTSLKEVVFCCFSEPDYLVYQALLKAN